MKTQTDGARKKASPKRSTRSEQPIDADAVIERANHAVAAWVAAIRARVKELADELGHVHAIQGRPEHRGAASILDTILDAAALGSLGQAITQAEEAVTNLFRTDTMLGVPDFRAACQAAFDAMRTGKSHETEARS